MKYFLKNAALATMAFTTVTLPTQVFAATGDSVIDCTSSSQGFTDLCDGVGDAGAVIRNAIIAILVISAVVALVFLIWGGFKWITSGGDKAKVETARNTIIAAVVGLIVTFLAYFILSIVLGIFNINLSDLSIPTIIP